MSDEPKIRSTPEIHGGAACIRNTRIMVWLLEAYRQDGLSNAELLDAYPTLTAEDLKNAWEYVKQHKEEINERIRKHDAWAKGE